MSNHIKELNSSDLPPTPRLVWQKPQITSLETPEIEAKSLAVPEDPIPDASGSLLS
jgi:hypothetical protein